MSIRVFAFDANPAVDRHLFTRSRDEILCMIRAESVRVLRDENGKEWAVQFRAVAEHTLRSQLSAYLATVPDVGNGETAEQLLDLFQSSNQDSSAAITDAEMKAIVGEPDGPGGDLSPVDILRARTKFMAWPYVGDVKAVRVGCRA